MLIASLGGLDFDVDTMLQHLSMHTAVLARDVLGAPFIQAGMGSKVSMKIIKGLGRVSMMHSSLNVGYASGTSAIMIDAG